ncbi:MAG: 50S ribosomal protein L25/general stress protein Ctc [Thiotrichales bacterium]|nr:50S ribosomal protein L25/general stress protein Ctc [Thiotrichales bacterium]
MDEFTLVAESRGDTGKGASRRLRKSEIVPAIVYGAKKAALSIQLKHSDVLKSSSQESFYSQILDLSIDGKVERVVLKDMQRHPYKPFVMHMDFQRVDESAALTIRIPVHFLNEEDCIGVKQEGGVIARLMTEIEITCLPKDLPESIEVDVANLSVGDAVHLADLVLPDGVEITSMTSGGDGAAAIVQVAMPRMVEEEEEPDSEEVDGADEASDGEDTATEDPDTDSSE